MRLFATQSGYADRLAAAVTELLRFSYKSIFDISISNILWVIIIVANPRFTD